MEQRRQIRHMVRIPPQCSLLFVYYNNYNVTKGYFPSSQCVDKAVMMDSSFLAHTVSNQCSLSDSMELTRLGELFHVFVVVLLFSQN